MDGVEVAGGCRWQNTCTKGVLREVCVVFAATCGDIDVSSEEIITHKSTCTRSVYVGVEKTSQKKCCGRQEGKCTTDQLAKTRALV